MPRMFLNGTAMAGQPDHGAISGATFLGPATTAPRYRFVAVRQAFPGLLPVDEGGHAIAGELYDLDEHTLFEVLLPGEPAELELGTIELADGREVHAMLLRPERLAPADDVVDISELGGWRAYQRFLADNRDLAERLAAAAT